MKAASELQPVIGTAPACEAVGVSRASFYRRQRCEHDPGGVLPKPPRRPTPRQLTDEERSAVLDTLHSPRFIDKAPAEAYATLLDEDVYLCSERTMYRVLAGAKEVRERRNQLRHPQYTKPELMATGPNQVSSWDITKLRGPAKFVWFYLYVVLDIFSRYVVGWMLAHTENATSASRLITTACENQQIQRDQLTIHADRGAAMRSKTLAQLYADLGVEPSHSRPRVSNDNPFSESQFKTFKYQPTFPQRFGCYEDAHSYCLKFFPWYHREHHHAGLGLMTPEAVHYGKASVLREKRQATLDAAQRRHPERFVAGRPVPPALPGAVWINPPPDPPSASAEACEIATSPFPPGRKSAAVRVSVANESRVAGIRDHDRPNRGVHERRTLNGQPPVCGQPTMPCLPNEPLAAQTQEARV
jgi:putative transposase